MPRAPHNLDFNDRRALPASGGCAIANISVFDIADRDQPRAALFSSLPFMDIAVTPLARDPSVIENNVSRQHPCSSI